MQSFPLRHYSFFPSCDKVPLSDRQVTPLSTVLRLGLWMSGKTQQSPTAPWSLQSLIRENGPLRKRMEGPSVALLQSRQRHTAWFPGLSSAPPEALEAQVKEQGREQMWCHPNLATPGWGRAFHSQHGASCGQAAAWSGQRASLILGATESTQQVPKDAQHLSGSGCGCHQLQTHLALLSKHANPPQF